MNRDQGTFFREFKILFSPTNASLAEKNPEDQSRENDIVTTSVAPRMATDVAETVSDNKTFHWMQVLSLMIRGVNLNRLDASALTIKPPPMIHDVIDPKCYNFTHGNYQAMEFYSPNYPGQYPNNVDCIMYLQAPPGFVIEMYFMDKFSVEETDGCQFDYIQLRDGPFGYSPFIAQFCGQKGFPETILTTTRFLWARFSSDGLVQFDGFRAVYEYKKDENYPLSTETNKVCRIYMDNMAVDGEFDSKVFPLGDTSQRDYPITQPVDCTWEMLAERGHRIQLSDVRLHMTREAQCNRNRIEIYDRTTDEDDRTGVYCGGQVQNYRSDSNRIFLRILGSRLSEKPVVSGLYTVYKAARTDSEEACDGTDFYCEGMCLSEALVCNGHVNCPDTKADEAGCASSTTTEEESEPIPLMAIVLAGVGGLIFTILIVGVCVTCRHRGSGGKKRHSGLQKQDSQKRNALEMAVSDSNNTAYALAKQNNPNYYSSLPRPAGHATMMPHRGSFSSKVPSEGDYGDHMSDTSTYKKFLQLEQNPDDDSSRCPSPYSPGFTTIIEHHQAPPGTTTVMSPGMNLPPGMPPGMTPGMTPDLGWNYPSHLETGMSPTLADNLSKLQQYTGMPKKEPGSPAGMTMDFRYDPTAPVYPMSKFRIKSPELTYGWKNEPTRPEGQALTIKNQDADTAPDLTREIETT